MKFHYYILFLLLFSSITTLKAQRLEVRIDYTTDSSNKNKMEGMNNVNNFGLQFSYFPFKKIPMALISNINFGNYSSLKFITQNNWNNINVSISDTLFTGRSNFYKYFLGIKIADQHSNRLFNPYFTAMVGMGFVNTKISLAESSSNGEDGYNTSTIGSDKIRHNDGIYRFELGLEMNLRKLKDRFNKDYSVTNISLFASFGLTGSFRRFEYTSIENIVKDIVDNKAQLHGQDLDLFFNSIQQKLHHKEGLYNEKLYLWTTSVGLIFRF